MEENTPRFFQKTEKTEELESVFSFSVEYKQNCRTKSNSKRLSKHSNGFHHNSRSKHKKSKTNIKSKFNKLEIPKTSFNFHSNKEISSKWNIFTIHEFLNKNKFKLNNNFDRKNSKRFLSSKEEALEKPFLFDELLDKSLRC